MSNRLALILTGAWTLIVIVGCSGAIWFVSAKVPQHQQEQRAQILGGGMATVAVIGYAAILLPWAVAWRRKREKREEEERETRRRRKRKRAEDDDESS